MKTVYLSLFLMLASFTALADPVWIDVRTIKEYNDDHIDGDIRISYEEITPVVENLIPDKTQQIVLYCRSGNRAGKALKSLQEAGYANVSNAGGIADVRKAREIE